MSLQRMQLSKARLEEALRVSDMPYYLQCVNLIFFFPHNSSFPSIFSPHSMEIDLQQLHFPIDLFNIFPLCIIKHQTEFAINGRAAFLSRKRKR